jgi:hypothetical protein
MVIIMQQNQNRLPYKHFTTNGNLFLAKNFENNRILASVLHLMGREDMI